MSESTTATDESVAPEPAPEPELIHGSPVTRHRGFAAVHVAPDQLVATVRALRDEGWLQCLDVTAVDYLAHPQSDLPPGVQPERFEVVVTLISHLAHERMRIRVQVPEADPIVPTLFEVHPGTEAMEREVFDMFGIAFEGHPDLTRILMPEDWEGHPLRKDYGIGRIPVQFKEAPDA
ncbi:NADH-quinone oxidoreductase subunit C [Aquihabitans sp. McL0605]|uniref:NADH-quinone oxidoreductase subunit C n=1 Tax=Aquihabitans sp. McL0605 TaxID=3415671 RepID=UPI003CFB76BD